MCPEKKGGSHKMARPQQNWGLLILLTRWASIWTMPNTASPKSEPPCGRAVYTPVRATILGHPPQKTAPGGDQATRHYLNQWWLDYRCIYASLGLNELKQETVKRSISLSLIFISPSSQALKQNKNKHKTLHNTLHLFIQYKHTLHMSIETNNKPHTLVKAAPIKQKKYKLIRVEQL